MTNATLFSVVDLVRDLVEDIIQDGNMYNKKSHRELLQVLVLSECGGLELLLPCVKGGQCNLDFWATFDQCYLVKTTEKLVEITKFLFFNQ